MQSGRFFAIGRVLSVALVLCVPFAASLTAGPLIGCPPGTIDISASKMSQVSVDLPIQGADSVYMPTGGWKNGKLSFVASRPGVWQLTVFAFSGTERASCIVKVNVRFDDFSSPDLGTTVAGEQMPAPVSDQAVTTSESSLITQTSE